MAKDRDVRRDRAGVGPDPEASRRRLISMDDLDGYTVASGEPDIRGWDVCTLNGRELGEVKDLLVDPDRGEVISLEMALHTDGVHVEVPLRSVQLDRKRKVVMVDSGDVEGANRSDVRARDRMSEEEREQVRGEYRGRQRDVRYSDRDAEARDAVHEDTVHAADGTEETVIERRPMVEEVVVRRRNVSGDEEK
jgi:hypothetical protein